MKHEDTQTIFVEVEKGGVYYSADVQVDLVTEGKHPFGTTRKNAEIVSDVIAIDDDGNPVDYKGECDGDLKDKALNKFN